MGEEEIGREYLWRQYNLWIDLYKFHLDLVLKANGFFYLITGSILTFYFANPERQLIRWSLLLPTFMSLVLGVTFLYGARLVKLKRIDIYDLAKKLDFITPPDVNALRVLLWACSVKLIVVAISLIILMAI